MKYIVIGDIHGQNLMLESAIRQIDSIYEKGDKIIFLGDYIDYRKTVDKVLDALIGIRDKYKDDVVFLRGNHDQMLLDAWKYNRCVGLWFQNGGYDTLFSYKDMNMTEWRDIFPREHRLFLQNDCVIEYQTEDYYFVHAGLPREDGTWEMRDNFYDARQWVRGAFPQETRDFGKLVVFGHTIQESKLPLVNYNKVGLDTGAKIGKDWPLTVAVFPEKLERNQSGFPEFNYLQINAKGKIVKEL